MTAPLWATTRGRRALRSAGKHRPWRTLKDLMRGFGSPPNMTPEQRRMHRNKRQQRRARHSIERAMRLVIGSDFRMSDPAPSDDKVLKIWQVLGLDVDLYDTIEGDSHPIASTNCRELRNSLFHWLWTEYKTSENGKRFRRNPWRTVSKEDFEASVDRTVAKTRKMMGLDVEVPETV